MRSDKATGIPDILQRILARKREEVDAAARREPLAGLRRRAEGADAPRGFTDALARDVVQRGSAVIAEIKKASPSKGVLRANYDPAEIARSYARGGATTLSVLTDRDFFQGDPEHLVAARAACSLPALRKDFLVDPYQVHEARVLGADCVLLIAAALDQTALRDLHDLAVGLGMDVLVEVHDRAELERALAIEPHLLGINNRDLRSFETRLDTTLELCDQVPEGVLLVTESGIHTRDAIALMQAAGVRAFLVGEAFMTAADPGERLAELFAAP